MPTIIEKRGTYHQNYDFVLPNIEEPERLQVGGCGRQRLQYVVCCENYPNITSSSIITANPRTIPIVAR